MLFLPKMVMFFLVLFVDRFVCLSNYEYKLFSLRGMFWERNNRLNYTLV